MAEIIRMPRLSDTMTEGVIVVWHKKVGDAIEIGDILADVETDKATMELEAYNDGVLLHVGVEEGQTVAIDTLIAVLGDKNDDIKVILEEADSAAPVADTRFFASFIVCTASCSQVIPFANSFSVDFL